MTAARLLDLLFLFVFLAAGQSQPTLTVQGLNGSSVTLTAVGFSKLPLQSVQATDHGTAATFEGLPLATVLAKVELPLGDKFHSTAASYFVSIEAADGYRAVFAWPELDSTFMDKAVWVVVKRDGKPLADRDGPFQLVVPDEKRGGRWVRQVKAIVLKKDN